MSPPVSAPPPAHPTTSLHYGHYGPDGQGWPSSAVSQPETSQSFPATGSQGPAQGQPQASHETGQTGPPPAPSSGTVYGAAPVADPRDEPARPTSGGYAARPTSGGYAARPTSGGYPAQQSDSGYAAQADSGYPPQADNAYPTQQANGGYTTQADSGYPAQQTDGGYTTQADNGYATQADGGYGVMPSALDRLSGQPAPVDPHVRVHGDSGQPPYGAYPEQAWGYETRDIRPHNGAFQEDPHTTNGATHLDPPTGNYQDQSQYPAQDQYRGQQYPAQEPYQAQYQQEQDQPQAYQPQQYQEQVPPPGYQQQQYPSQEYPQQEYPQQQYPSQEYQQQPRNGYQGYDQVGPEFDWAAPPQEHVPAPALHPVPAPALHPVPAPALHPVPAPALHPVPSLPTQRVPEDDPLVGPLPSELLGNATPLSAAEPTMPAFASEPPYGAQEAPEPHAADSDRFTAEADWSNGPELPQRVPSHPDVPQVPEVEVEPLVAEVTPAAGGAELARIATFLREEREDEDDEPSLDDRPDGFDIPAVLRAVQGVSGVREATLRKNADGLHTLRLELLDEADPGRVSRAVARLLNERMGLAAEPNPPEPAPQARPAVRNNAPHSALPGYGREARRRRPVSGVRRPAEAPRPDLDEIRQPPRPPEPSNFITQARQYPVPTPQTTGEQLVAGPQPPTPVNREAPPALVPQSSSIVSPRVIIDQVEVSTQGVDAVVEVRLIADGHPAVGVASGPAVDGYILRLSAAAAASAVDQLLVDVDATSRARCYIEHAAVVQLGGCEVAVVVLLLLYDGWVEQLTGSSVNSGDPRQAVVRATLAAVNRRLEALLP